MGADAKDTVTERSLVRADFPVLRTVATRWTDNDVYGHLNNAVYFSIVDSVVNGWLIERIGLRATDERVIGVVVESGCRYYRELAYPSPIDVGLAVARIGRSSVSYRLGLFDGATDDPAAAVAHFVHVYIDRETRDPVDIPAKIRASLETLTR